MSDTFNVLWDDIEISCNAILRDLKKRDMAFDVICPVVRGGMVPGAILSHALGVTDVRPIMYQSRASNHRSLNLWKDLTSTDKRVLVVDDILDSGHTFSVLKAAEAFSARVTYAAVVVNSDAEKTGDVDVRDVIAGMYIHKKTDPNIWVMFPWEASSTPD